MQRIIANKSTVDGDSPTYLAHFDSDSFHIDIDTLCTCIFSGNKIISKTCNFTMEKSVAGITGWLEIADKGAFIFQIKDDNGQVESIRIHCSFYVPSLKLPLLFLQHWAQTATTTQSIMEQKSCLMRMGALCCGDNEWGKN